MSEIADVDTEDVVLGSVIFYPKEYSRVAQYIPENKVFTQTKAKSLWVKLTKMIKNGKKIDLPMLCASITNEDMLSGVTTGYILDITNDVCSMGMMESYAQIIYEKYLIRKIVEETENIKKDALHRGGDVYSLINHAHSLMGELIRVRPGDKFTIDLFVSETDSVTGEILEIKSSVIVFSSTGSTLTSILFSSDSSNSFFSAAARISSTCSFSFF